MSEGATSVCVLKCAFVEVCLKTVLWKKNPFKCLISFYLYDFILLCFSLQFMV